MTERPAEDNRSEQAVRDREPLVRWEELLPTALGAALAALVLSRLGVAGTIIGSACTPVIITLTSAVISRQIEYARERAASRSVKRRESWWQRFSERLPRGRRLLAALATAAAAFAIVAVLITVAEALTGKAVSDWGHTGGSGYTFSGGNSSPAPSRMSPSQTLTSTHPTPTSTHPTQTATHQTTSTTSPTQTRTATSSTTTTSATTSATTSQTTSTASPSGTAPQLTQTTPGQ
jgi:hypothetical protein